MEVRTSKTAGRSLFAMRAVPPGTVLLRVPPHLAILDKSHLSILCSHCMLDKPEMQEPLRRCSACKAVYYCSVVSGCRPCLTIANLAADIDCLHMLLEDLPTRRLGS
jgi:hypothetical protein